MAGKTRVYKRVSDMVEDTLGHVGGEVVLAMPIGAGQPVIIANEFYRRAAEDPGIKLRILTGLTLEKPRPGSELERRFLEPFIERILPDFPDPVYMRDIRRGKLPPNVEIVEYFLRSGAFLNVPDIQQNYSSTNYTHIARDMADAGANVGAAIVSKRIIDGSLKYSISSNASASLDLMKILMEKKRYGAKVELLGLVNANMPFMFGGCVQDPLIADRILDNPEYYHTVFGPPREPVTTEDFFIGMYAASLVKDGGTIQIGIGALGDAIGYSLSLRRENNLVFRDFMTDAGALRNFSAEIYRIGGLDELTSGLYGCTEMLTDPFIRLMNAGIISRRVYDNLTIQSMVSGGQIDGRVDALTLALILKDDAFHFRLRKKDFSILQEFGIFKKDLRLENGKIVCGDLKIDADLADRGNFQLAVEHCLGDSLKGGAMIHGGFFLGPPSFYESLRAMNDGQLARINMREISFVNQLYGDEELKRLQRLHARFFNTAMMVTALGATVSDGLENGQVVSGVGGQYNFVSMAHALEDGRSVIMVRSTKQRDGGVIPNFLWNYGHVTIPRHLRDVFVSEYGIADVRGLPDRKVIAAILNICDSRFQNDLLEKAKQAGKISKDYSIPDCFRNNTPERLKAEMAKYHALGFFPAFPFGSEFTDDELVLAKALKTLKEQMAGKEFIPPPQGAEVPQGAARFLERMRLDKPATVEEESLRALVVHALREIGAL